MRTTGRLAFDIAKGLITSGVLAALLAACDAAPGNAGAGGTGGGTGGSFVGGFGGTPAGVGGSCDGQEPPPLDDVVSPPVMTGEFEPHYNVYDLGPVPGMPAGHLGGCVALYNDPDTLLIAGNSESAEGQLYSIKMKRDACGHVLGFEGTAQLVATTPYIDANLLYGKENVLLYSQWPANQVSQLLPGAGAPALTTDLLPFGVESSIGGMGFVPPGFATEGTLRGITWQAGNWFQLATSFQGGLYQVTGATKVTTLPNGPGGFAYVPAGSPGFPAQSVIMAEWSVDKVAVYEVDGQGDPLAATRKEFFSYFPKPWGAYFEPVSGDYLFLTWGPTPDRVYVVRGFVPPPEPPK
jgi:hypothetical protein